MLAFRARGAEYGYYFGLSGSGKVALVRRNHSDSILAEAEYPWEFGESYTLEAKILTLNESCKITCLVNGSVCLEYTDSDPQPYGMAGLVKTSAGRTRFLSLSAREV